MADLEQEKQAAEAAEQQDHAAERQPGHAAGDGDDQRVIEALALGVVHDVDHPEDVPRNIRADDLVTIHCMQLLRARKEYDGSEKAVLRASVGKEWEMIFGNIVSDMTKELYLLAEKNVRKNLSN